MREEWTNWPGFAERLAERMRDLKLSPKVLGARVGVARSTVSEWRLGNGGPRYADVLERLARELETTVSFLKFGVSDDDSFVVVVGAVGMGGLIVSDSIERIRVPAPQGLLGSQLEAYLVEDTSNSPIYVPGDTIFINPNATVPLDRLLGADCLIETADGRRFLRRLMPGPASDTYTLEAYAAQPMSGVQVSRAWHVRSVLRREIT